MDSKSSKEETSPADVEIGGGTGTNKETKLNVKRTTASKKGQPPSGDPWDYYRGKGFSVFPVHEDKTPVLRWGEFQRRYATDEEIAQWRKAGWGIGIVCGPISGISVVDIDSGEALQEFEALNLDGVRTPQVITPTGGRHFYFKYDLSLLPKTDKERGKSRKIDIRSEGGFAVVHLKAKYTKKGKLITGNYVWDERDNFETVPIGEPPKRLVYRLHPLCAQPPGTIATAEAEGEGEAAKFVEGRRDNDLFHTAWNLRKAGVLERAEIERIIVEKARKCQPPFDEREAMRKVESAYSRAMPQTARGAGSTPVYTPIITELRTVTPEATEWLWRNRIPAGKFSLISGDGGAGKSFLSLYLASIITRGDTWPDGAAPPARGTVIVLTAEDGLADTVRPRADAMRADVDRIKVIEGARDVAGNEEFFNLTTHISALEAAVQMYPDVRLIIIDPLTAYLGVLDTHKESIVRSVLGRVEALAMRRRAAVLGIMHLNKDETKKALYRTSGSQAFVNAARAVWCVSIDPNDSSDSPRRLLTLLKLNLSTAAANLAFRIISRVGASGESVGEVVFEEEEVALNAEDALSAERREASGVVRAAADWLREALSDGPVDSANIFRMAEENHITEYALKKAKDLVGATSNKEGGRESAKWLWRLP